jgi:hypothetical protein
MKTISQKLALYLFNNFIGNFLGFIVGMASTRLVSHFFATKSIKNLWGLTTRKTLVDKQTFNILELTISILIGFIVFELISKGVKKKMNEALPSWKLTIKKWFVYRNDEKCYTGEQALVRHQGSKKIYRDVQ